MSVITQNSAMTLAEVVRRQGYDDAAAVLGELGQLNDFLDEVPWFPATHGTHNKALQANRLGTGGFSAVNAARNKVTSGTVEVSEPVKMYDGDSDVDERALAGAQDVYKVRDSEDAINLEGIIQDWIYNLIYTNEGTDQDAFRGLAARRAAVATNRCWDEGGDGADLASMWIFEFSRRGFYLAYNASGGQMPGIKNEDRGRHLVDVPTGTGEMWAWVRHYEIAAAMVLRDDRALQRIANIESSGSSNIFDPATFISMKNQLPSVGRNAVSFVNRTVKAQIDNNAYAKTNVWFSIREVQNYGPITYIADVPVRMMEPLLITESALS